MIALRVTGHAGPAQRTPRGHRQLIDPKPRTPAVERCGECPACRSDMADLTPCMRRPS